MAYLIEIPLLPFLGFPHTPFLTVITKLTTLSTDSEPGNLNGFPALSIYLKGFGVIYFFIVLQDSELNLQNIHPNYL